MICPSLDTFAYKIHIAAKVRTVHIDNLPYNATPNFIASLVYGGAVEDIHTRTSAAGDTLASIRFVDAEQCSNFYHKTANGIVYKKDVRGRDVAAFVELGQDVDVVGGLLQTWIDNDTTRCVRAVGVGEELSRSDLKVLAEAKGRKLEGLQDGKTPGGVCTYVFTHPKRSMIYLIHSQARSIIFRFCKMAQAVEFKAALTRNEEFEQCNISFTADP